MPGKLLTTGSTVQCPHGGIALLLTSNAKALCADGPVLLESDVHVVMGCPFTVGTVYTPCLRIEWHAPGAKSNAGGAKPLVESSVGVCYGPTDAPQGVAVIAATQQGVSSL